MTKLTQCSCDQEAFTTSVMNEVAVVRLLLDDMWIREAQEDILTWTVKCINYAVLDPKGQR